MSVIARKLFCIAGIPGILLLMSVTAWSQIWLDQPLANWNQTAIRVPQAPATSNDSLIRCKSQSRSAENLLDQAVLGAGWMLFGPIQGYGTTVIITAMSGANNSCRPSGYQAFVFSDGKVAGTLSPAVMNSQTDGSIQNIRMFSDTSIEVDFSRVPTSDISTVRFEIQKGTTGPLLVPMEIRRAKQFVPEAVVPTPAPAVAPAPPPEVPKSPEPPKPAPVADPAPNVPAATTPVVEQTRSELLGPIQNSSLLKGCGCYLKSTSAAGSGDPTIFLTDISIEKRGWANISGEDLSLAMIRTTMPKEKKFKASKGFQFQEEYVAGNVHIVVEYVVKKLPAEGQSFAEYDAILTVTVGDRKETIPLAGICGCM